MQSVSSRIWTRVAMSISYDDNHYTIYILRVCVCVCVCVYIYKQGVALNNQPWVDMPLNQIN